MQIDIQAICTPTCTCGAKMQRGDSNAIYGNDYEDLHCDGCNGAIPGAIYHCPHGSGYDLCMDCVRKPANDCTRDIYSFIHKSLKQTAENNLQLSKSEAVALVRELSRFYYLKMISEDYDAEKLSPSKKIDEIWHLHLLHPKQYQQFCQEFVGPQVIDHSPDKKSDGGHAQRLRNTLRLYRAIFQEKAPDNIWYEPAAAIRSAPAC